MENKFHCERHGDNGWPCDNQCDSCRMRQPTTSTEGREEDQKAVGDRSNGKKIYIASKTVHYERWKDLRDDGINIISTWIDEAGEGESIDLADLAARCIKEAAEAEVTIVYAEDGEYLKGAFIEMGAALAFGRIIHLVGPALPPTSPFANHKAVYQCASVEDSIYKSTGIRVAPPTPSSPAE